MRILSLFDGISVGYHAIKSMGGQIDQYFASEIDHFAIQVSKSNYPDIIQLGDIKKLDESNLPLNIDIIIAGFPCQSFSQSGKRLGFDDDRSKLFWELMRVKEVVNPSYFLFENSGGMKLKDQKIITDALNGIHPVQIDSALVSAQRRKRLYFTNIPFKMPEDKRLFIKDIICEMPINLWSKLDHYSEKTKARIFRNLRSIDHKALTICCNSRSFGSNGATVIQNKNNPELFRILNRYELELLQGLPMGFTKRVSKTQAIKLLGNSFNSPTISHILRTLI